VGLAPETVRRHLNILQRDQLVAFHQVRHKAGRPEHGFYLTEAGHEALPKHYNRLLQWLLQEMASADPVPQSLAATISPEELFRRIGRRLAQQHVGPLAEQPLQQRLLLLEEVLRAEGFSPEMERGGGTLRIHLLNCPFRRVAMESSAVCALDMELIASILGARVSNIQCINRGGSHCSYTTADIQEAHSLAP
jgi:predicted ArsR family transcriptional regulator